jgi:DNA repair protein RadD
MKFNLRKYQEDGIATCMDYMTSTSSRKPIAVFPCAAGKSIIIAEVANRLKEPVLVLQPSLELLKQNYAKLVAIGGEAEIYSAGLGSKEIGHLTYATIGSIKKDWQKLRDLGLKHVILDECHFHSKVTGQIGTFLKNVGIIKVLGLTATPLELRTTMEGTKLAIQTRSRKNLFNEIIHVTQVKEMTDGNYWSPLDYKQVDIDTDMLVYNTTNTEFTDFSIKEFYRENDMEAKIQATIRKLLDAGYNSILVAVPSIQTANDLANCFPYESTSISSKTSPKDREINLDSFNNGDVQVMFQVRILTTGYDRPDLQIIVDANPTNSFASYYQLVGRVVRIEDGKDKGVIIDLSGNYERFGKLENITFENIPNFGWGMFNGEDLLTGISIIEQYKPQKSSLGKSNINKAVSEAGTMPYGKWKGRKVENVKVDYLQWCRDNWDFSKLGNLKERMITVINANK